MISSPVCHARFKLNSRFAFSFVRCSIFAWRFLSLWAVAIFLFNLLWQSRTSHWLITTRQDFFVYFWHPVLLVGRSYRWAKRWPNLYAFCPWQTDPLYSHLPWNSDSGRSTRACSSLRITPPSAMNLLLRGRPEIAIYPCNLFQPFRKFSPKLTLRARNDDRKVLFRAAFWKCDHVPPRIARDRESREFFFRRNFSDRRKCR